jgi:secreted Zn-dependent insulinase-like peptidase
LTGIKKHGGEFNIDLNTNSNSNSNSNPNSNSIYNYNKDNYMVGLIEMLAINPKKYLIKNTSKYTNSDENKQSQIKFENYKINANYINPNEINNCIIRYWCLDTIDISNNNLDNIDLETGKKIIKKSIVLRIISEILNEPLFDKIRTIDKLGYIVKCDFKIIINNNKIYYLILFLIQSSYSIKKISTSIEDFNEYIIKDLKTNYQNYLEKFRLLKESKLLEFSKPIYDLSDEVNIYIEAIVSKLFYFNFNELFFSECKKIEFETDIAPEIKNINRKKSIYSNIILEKKID